jgi:dihydrofolate reductase
MRKLKLQVQISINGFIAGPNGEMDWLTWNHDTELLKFITALTDSCDTIILGRKLAEGFIPYWANIAGNKEDPQYSFGKIMHDYHKVVFTKTLAKSDWPNTVLANGDLVEEINKLKNQDGKDIVVYGGADFVSNLIENNLIDELNLFVNPVAIGDGMAIFKAKKDFTLLKSSPFSCGINVLTYKPLNK